MMAHEVQLTLKLDKMSDELLKYVSEVKLYDVTLPEYEARLFRILLRALEIEVESEPVGFHVNFNFELLRHSKKSVLIDKFLKSL